ncbi:putative oligomerization/nucleic acid binding protein [Jatrophihabitans sp. GAS493]|uniref:SHOCT domain-containing protein n=1 Tax=Jatrophihabitans sp. GAS493 TaxID=1907575 RepID=UPI000BB7C23D|nr:SHOCT domain-containing protein [Jatrophihabitans sp. GAS493]SOD72471.1 putative oligomerization/nucleic acid binding protein [Jatrophihabitans sp. GAS493]
MFAATSLAASPDYPLLNLFWTMLEIFIWVLWLFLLIKIFTDIFRSQDLGSWGKAGWAIVILLLPFLGSLIYLIARGSSMHTRDIEAAKSADQAMRSYIQATAATSTSSTAEELHKLADLRDRGVLTAAEFDAQKAKLLA